MPEYTVATFAQFDLTRRSYQVQAYLRDYNPGWSGIMFHTIDAPTGREAKRRAKAERLQHEKSRESESAQSRYELLKDDERFGLKKGDILICASMHWAWAAEKISVERRERDGYEPGCSQYRGNLRHISGPRV